MQKHSIDFFRRERHVVWGLSDVAVVRDKMSSHQASIIFRVELHGSRFKVVPVSQTFSTF